jgi:hypothetical protein
METVHPTAVHINIGRRPIRSIRGGRTKVPVAHKVFITAARRLDKNEEYPSLKKMRVL